MKAAQPHLPKASADSSIFPTKIYCLSRAWRFSSRSSLVFSVRRDGLISRSIMPAVWPGDMDEEATLSLICARVGGGGSNITVRLQVNNRHNGEPHKVRGSIYHGMKRHFYESNLSLNNRPSNKAREKGELHCLQ